jgi:hypothetical protein
MAEDRGIIRMASTEVVATSMPESGAAVVDRTLPSIGRQKTFIVENASILDRGTKIAILSIVMMELGDIVTSKKVVAETKRVGGEVDINLDVAAEVNPEIVTHIYNIVRARRDTLNQPAKMSS